MLTNKKAARAAEVRLLHEIFPELKPNPKLTPPSVRLRGVMRRWPNDPLREQRIQAERVADLRGMMRKILDRITTREDQILRMRFGISQKTGHTLEEVGKQFVVTRERIRLIEAKAIRKLRQAGRSRNLEGFTERD